MLYLNKLLQNIKQNLTLFKTPDIILILGLSSSCIKELKKFAIENGFVSQQKQECILTKKGEKYLSENPVEYWCSKEFPLRPDINLEYLKEEKTPPILTKAIRNLAKHLIELKYQHLFLYSSIMIYRIPNTKVNYKYFNTSSRCLIIWRAENDSYDWSKGKPQLTGRQG